MNKFYIIFLLIFNYTSYIYAQDDCTNRYRDQVFNSVEFHGNIVFGSWPATQNGVKPLRYDIYAPKDDTASLRPLIILWHGGAFLDLFTKSSPDIVMMAKDLAKRGYVVISPDYRGIRDLTDFFSKKELVKEVVGAAIDGNQAICHILHQIENEGNPYRINKDEIFAGGVSGGAVLGLHLILLEQTDDLPEAFRPWAREVDHGAIDALLENKYCGHPGVIKGFINISGALIDTNIIKGSSTHFLHSHGKKDGIVPYHIGEPLGGITDSPELYGSQPIHEQMELLGIPSTFISYDKAGHVPFLNLDLESLFSQFHIVNIEIFDETIQKSIDLIYPMITCEKNTTATNIASINIQELNFYPNPVIDEVLIQTPEHKKWDLKISNLEGKTIQEHQFIGSQYHINLKSLYTGMYILHLVDQENPGTLWMNKFIKID